MKLFVSCEENKFFSEIHFSQHTFSKKVVNRVVFFYETFIIFRAVKKNQYLNLS